MRMCKHFHVDGAMHIPCYKCKVEDLERQVAALTKERDELGGELMEFFGAPVSRNLRDQLAAAQEQITTLTKENDRLKTVPMKYRRMEFNAQLQNQLAAEEAVNEKLREALITEANIYTENDPEDGPPEYIVEALALPSDDSALQARLAEEREKIVVWLRNNYQDYSLSGVCDAIRSMK